MAKASWIIGCVATGLFVVPLLAMKIFVHGEKDWNLAIAIVLCLVGAIMLGLVGTVVATIAILRKRGWRSWTTIALVLNLIPPLWFVLMKSVYSLY